MWQVNRWKVSIFSKFFFSIFLVIRARNLPNKGKGTENSFWSNDESIVVFSFRNRSVLYNINGQREICNSHSWKINVTWMERTMRYVKSKKFNFLSNQLSFSGQSSMTQLLNWQFIITIAVRFPKEISLDVPMLSYVIFTITIKFTQSKINL